MGLNRGPLKIPMDYPPDLLYRYQAQNTFYIKLAYITLNHTNA